MLDEMIDLIIAIAASSDAPGDPDYQMAARLATQISLGANDDEARREEWVRQLYEAVTMTCKCPELLSLSVGVRLDKDMWAMEMLSSRIAEMAASRAEAIEPEALTPKSQK